MNSDISTRESAAPAASLLQRIRVPAGFLFATLVVVLSRPTKGSLAAGVAVGAAGMVIRIWAAGSIRKSRELAVSGPYALTRNPLYLGSFLMGLGVLIAAAHWWLLLAFVIVFVLLYFPVMKREEQELTSLFQEAYTQYRRGVPLFVPRLHTGRVAGAASAQASFSWGQVRANREYQAAAGFLAAMLLLVLKRWLQT
ncbi:MAG: methyltransferase family protein [Acidobacteriota bacterium]